MCLSCLLALHMGASITQEDDALPCRVKQQQGNTPVRNGVKVAQVHPYQQLASAFGLLLTGGRAALGAACPT